MCATQVGAHVGNDLVYKLAVEHQWGGVLLEPVPLVRSPIHSPPESCAVVNPSALFPVLPPHANEPDGVSAKLR